MHAISRSGWGTRAALALTLALLLSLSSTALAFASNGNAFPVFEVAKKNRGTKFNEASFTFRGGLPVTGGTLSSTAAVLFSGQTPL